MATFKKFEDIEAWQKSRQLTKQIYRISRTGAFARDYGLRDQIRQFLATAKGSAAEVKCQLYVALDEGYINNSTFDDLSKLVSEIGKMIGGLIRI